MSAISFSWNDLLLVLGIGAAVAIGVVMTRLSARAHRDNNERDKQDRK